MIQFFHRGAIIRPLAVPTKDGFEATALIESEGGQKRLSGPLGRFPSINAANNFAIDWAIDHLQDPPFPRSHEPLTLVPKGKTE